MRGGVGRRPLRSVYRARPCATRRSLTAATARLQSLRGSSPDPTFCHCEPRRGVAISFPGVGEVKRDCFVAALIAMTGWTFHSRTFCWVIDLSLRGPV